MELGSRFRAGVPLRPLRAAVGMSILAAAPPRPPPSLPVLQGVSRHRRAPVLLAHISGRAPVPPASESGGGGGWAKFWAAVDASAWLGTVGAAAAFVITQEAMLAAAPVVLPLLALYASRQRARLTAERAAATADRDLHRLLLQARRLTRQLLPPLPLPAMASMRYVG